MQIRNIRTPNRVAFTLVEMLVVVAIIVVLAGVGTPILLHYLEAAKDDADRAKARTIADTYKMFTMQHEGTTPTSLQELSTTPVPGSNKPYLPDDALKDARGQYFQMDPSGQQSGTEVDVYTTNPKSGEVIGNWKKRH